jgi:hypothetical protein
MVEFRAHLRPLTGSLMCRVIWRRLTLIDQYDEVNVNGISGSVPR